MKEIHLLPCQERWLCNKIVDMTGRTYYISPCPHDNIREAILISVAGDASEKEVIQLIQEGCSQHCPYHNDTENIGYWYNADIEQ